MTSSSSSGDACRRPWLAAYADGQLPEPQRQRVERWLACHPQDWSVVEQERALTDTIQQWWAATAPSPPTAAQWQELAQRIQDACALTHRSQRMAQQSRRTSVRMVRRALIAASVLLIISLGWLQPWRENQVPGPAAEPALAQQTETLDPAGLALTPSATDGRWPVRLPLAQDNEVILERVPHLGTGWLPVGRPPCDGGMPLLRSDEIVVVYLVPAAPAVAEPLPLLAAGEEDAAILVVPRR